MQTKIHPIQQTILDCIAQYPALMPRSGWAKLLVGSSSMRVEEWQNNDYFGRFSTHKRKSIMHHIDILIQQGHLDLDWQQHLIPVERHT